LRWFDRIVPAYWLVVKDVREGRARLNFSDLGNLPPGAQKAALFEAVNQVRLGAMPPRAYTRLHPEARIASADVETLERWLRPVDHGDATVPVAAQYAAPISARVAPAPNGIPFIPDYVDWKPISTTHRFDNQTQRVILGNPVAMKAIAARRIMPWPDGTTFAKVAWSEAPDVHREGSAARFVQVELMIKDARRFSSTEGWGFARWRGDALTPYGADASFVNECTGCHAPMRANDFVYTMPIAREVPGDAWNRDAALPAGLSIDPLQWRVMTASVDSSADTMSTVFANDVAMASAPVTPPIAPAVGAVFARVTWSREPDRHWFGGDIPGRFRRLEIVSAAETGGEIPYAYQEFEGVPPKLLSPPPAPVVAARVLTILGPKR
jgi:hypothetical protein